MLLDRRRSLLLVALAASAARPTRAGTAAPAGATRASRRPLDLRLRREELGAGVGPPATAPIGSATVPEAPSPRPGLALELRPARRGRAEAAGGEAGPAERDALATRLDRLGLEELVIRLVRPL